LLAPILLGIFNGLRVHLTVFLEGLDVRALAEFFRRRNGFFFEDVRVKL